MKILAWVYFTIYSLGLIISVIPFIKVGAVIAILAIAYVVFAQFWFIWMNRKTFKGFFKSCVFHLIPMIGIAYFIGSQSLYLVFQSETENKILAVITLFLTLALPFVILFLQYFVFKISYKNSGISVQN